MRIKRELELERRDAFNIRVRQAENVDVNYFAGPHPAEAGIQIHHLNPINKGEIVWVVNAMDLAIIGRLFTSGKFDARKTMLSQVQKLKSLLTTKPFWEQKSVVS